MGADQPHEFRWLCRDCGHQCDELAENGCTEDQAYCPMCGGGDVEARVKESAFSLTQEGTR
jgi:hypothetical protein